MTGSQPDLKRYTEANRAAWNEVMPFHRRAAGEALDRLFAEPGYVHLARTEIDLLERAGLEGRDVVHLCCNNGVELMSLKNLGAGRCTGFDISEVAIAEARERAACSRIDCQFVRSDVYEIDPGYHGQFDIAYMSAGCLGWMPDLPRFFKVAAALLRPDGLVFIHEIHPFAEMLPQDDTDAEGRLRIDGPYFKAEPYVDQGGLDYLGNTAYESTTTQYWFMHTLSGILMALIKNGIVVEQFHEYETAISPEHRRFEAAKAGVPLSYVLVGRKPHGVDVG